jgi:hypothetical protein
MTLPSILFFVEDKLNPVVLVYNKPSCPGLYFLDLNCLLNLFSHSLHYPKYTRAYMGTLIFTRFNRTQIKATLGNQNRVILRQYLIISKTSLGVND